VKVQGEGAAEEIARAIDTMNQRACADVLIVGRGGGSLEDLWAFNEECVASAIYRSTIPVISAVGHETDFCIADCVADLRAPTPSAAAELTSSETARELHHLEQTGARLYAHLRAQLGVHKLRLAQYRHSPFLSRPQLLLEPHWQKVDEVGAELDRMLRERIQQRRLALESTRKQLELLRPDARIRLLKERIRPLQEQIDRWMRERCARKKEQLQQLSSHLKSIDPNSLLAQGYCILFRENTTSVILSAEELSAGERLSIRLQGGSAVAQVVEVTP
jgi:exodeoxyribonuclease VII large subunit